jgi:hypothetical protein
MKTRFGSFALVVFGLCSAASVLAMTSGTPADGDGHPAVVALLRSPDGVWARPFCSGMLVSGKVVLTASHCMAYAKSLEAAEWRVSVTNDPSLQQDGNGWLPLSSLTHDAMVSQIVLNPRYDPNKIGGYDHDVSAAVLDAPLGVDPAAFGVLPPSGVLDQLNADGSLRKAKFSVLGYGILEKPVPARGQWYGEFSTDRRIGTLGFDALDTRFIHQSQRIHQGEDGACNGDSGGPSLLAIGGVTYVVGVTSSGDIPCYATNLATRTDSEEALALLAQVLAANPD